ncbi:M20 family metallopeptidase [Bacillus amyloliquefaciens]|jgi:arginine utilization protein RocB|uniref:M20 family metallopeptidase n=1 Tax=Bacillus amyloliquefaciens TaxID=1390 RepID=UPI0015804655|nr:M20/M25/M40 family metallo-hydrolase [Bacillus amyloliquefaciens]NUI21010.1 M20/M25/M40 family metallo-hydrolase [Bacillus amyloliquefaciens]NUI30625.1 M20/M25/M40 family metallo-hydrolase [Bacillus amyloliquefaciens]NUI33703.1 M20/M25/M40 family metallo-hydrolase [Bacillus amyloliquefaciens]NUI68178.1 M20/M25/M40 family metallo-hydrolase [Bacillus amyloliquefaciens]NUI71259.1 M20/M25/M40 family metallo-hydrolase [Bacillus amyloliquefaciens]
MYQQLSKMLPEEKIEAITKSLVALNSINGTLGEGKKADYIKDMIKSFPYFQENPSHVWEQAIPEDPYGRKNIFAFIEGNGESLNTVIYHAHLDTVGIEDFGPLKDIAFDSDRLAEYFLNYEFDRDVQRDARSGEWMFGRGSVDMQSGIAVHLANLLHFSERRDQLPGHILFMANPDEESQHSGILTSISELKRLKQEKQLRYLAAINNDFITPLYEGDTTRYIYTGAAGKLLPCFAIYGREVHVGDTLSGIDPNLIASEITRRIHNNIHMAENIEGELVLPPTCLYQRDNKEAYNVQTAVSSYVYFNYFIYEKTAKEVMDQLTAVADEACRETEQKLSDYYDEYCERTSLPKKEMSWNVQVYSLEDYLKRLRNRGIDPAQCIEQTFKTYEHLELRMRCFKAVEELQKLDPEQGAKVIIFYAPPYLPHNYLKEESTRDRLLQHVIQEAVDKTAASTGETFVFKKFFPYLADGSFLSLHETDEEVSAFTDNFPGWDVIGTIPFKEIRELNIPSVNIGVYGKDGHKWTERVYKPYTFHVLPELIQQTTMHLLHSYRLDIRTNG